MLFNSIEFLFFFLPAVLLGFLLLQRLGHLRPIKFWLVACSLFFYAWWNPVYLLLLLLSAGVNYSLGRVLAKGGKDQGRQWLVLGIAFNLGLLGYFKYGNFFLDSVTQAMHWGFNFEYIVLPLAISFYTFQQITYLVDSRKGLTDSHNLLDYLLFVSFFPQLIAGPIVHHKEILPQFSRLTDRSKNSANITIGLSILVVGLFKKVVVADGFGFFSNGVFTLAAAGSPLATLDALVGVFAYSFQLYFDFSGYSDMAIGLACLFGIKLPVNFFSPFRAQNISDFWRMWHATLARFLRDYVYAPLGGFFCSPGRQRFNLFTTMFIGGVWHGAGWTFIVYGLCHGSYVIIHQLWRVKVSGPLGLVGKKSYNALAQVFTFLVVALTLVVFRADSLATAGRVYSSLFNWNGFQFLPAYEFKIFSNNALELMSGLFGVHGKEGVIFFFLALALAACWLLPSTYQLFRHCDIAIDKPLAGREPIVALQWQDNWRWGLFIGILAIASMVNLTQVSEFLYFQF
ncbi:Peptidoglycan O-acetyltransferase [Halioglobus japonicus]|nr:Peptidoglycan O-acetyltransferase [Halioglobus japonicus]